MNSIQDFLAREKEVYVWQIIVGLTTTAIVFLALGAAVTHVTANESVSDGGQVHEMKSPPATPDRFHSSGAVAGLKDFLATTGGTVRVQGHLQDEERVLLFETECSNALSVGSVSVDGHIATFLADRDNTYVTSGDNTRSLLHLGGSMMGRWMMIAASAIPNVITHPIQFIETSMDAERIVDVKPCKNVGFCVQSDTAELTATPLDTDVFTKTYEHIKTNIHDIV